MEYSAKNIWIAYSGGLDSSVLLHQFVQRRQQENFVLRAVHVHHGLHPKADEWQKHCENICAAWHVELSVHYVDLSSSHDNIEERARQLRYQHFASLLNESDILCTAHHQDDQSETLLLQLMRGAGTKGLSAMPEELPLGRGRLVRPLLHSSRDDLVSYAAKNMLSWVDDDSNYNTRFARNFLRQNILPLLKQRWPRVSATISRSAKHCAETEDLLREYAEKLLLSCVGAGGTRPLISRLKLFTFAQQKLIIRHWLSKQQFLLPSESKLENLLHTFLNAAEDKNPMMSWGDVEVRRYRDDLFVMQKLPMHDVSQVLPWFSLASCGSLLKEVSFFIKSLDIKLRAKSVVGKGVKILSHQRCDIRFRDNNASLKKRFQTWGVPPWLRERIPLLYVDGQLAAVIGHEICASFRVAADQEGVVIDVIKQGIEN